MALVTTSTCVTSAIPILLGTGVWVGLASHCGLSAASPAVPDITAAPCARSFRRLTTHPPQPAGENSAAIRRVASVRGWVPALAATSPSRCARASTGRRRTRSRCCTGCACRGPRSSRVQRQPTAGEQLASHVLGGFVLAARPRTPARQAPRVTPGSALPAWAERSDGIVTPPKD